MLQNVTHLTNATLKLKNIAQDEGSSTKGTRRFLKGDILLMK